MDFIFNRTKEENRRGENTVLFVSIDDSYQMRDILSIDKHDVIALRDRQTNFVGRRIFCLVYFMLDQQIAGTNEQKSTGIVFNLEQVLHNSTTVRN